MDETYGFNLNKAAERTEKRRMRTTIVIDDKLMRDVLRATKLKTKREAVELGLRTLLRLNQQEQTRKLRGQLETEYREELRLLK